MKDSRILLILLLIFSLFLLGNDKVIAEECSSNTMSSLKKTVANIEINSSIDEEYNPMHEYYYNIRIVNFSSDFYIIDSLDNRFEYSNLNADSVYGMYAPSTTVTFNIYASECDELLRTIEITFDYYNEYSVYEECDGIEEFYLCSKNYSGDIESEEWFLEIVQGYKEGTIENNVEEGNHDFFDYLKEHLVLIFLSLIIILGIIIVLVKRKRFRDDRHD